MAAKKKLEFHEQDITGKVVVVKAEFLPGKPVTHRLFLPKCGFGCSGKGSGTAVFGRWLRQNAEERIERWMVERLATPEEVEAGSAGLVEEALRVLMGRVGMSAEEKAKHAEVLAACQEVLDLRRTIRV